MQTKRKLLLGAAATLALTTGVAACGGGGGGGNSTQPPPRTKAVQGGALHINVDGVIDHLDPQRQYVGLWIADFGRTVYRSLLAFPSGVGQDQVDKASTPVPDLATNLGSHNADATVWTFTLKDGVKWQDGSPITCADLKYGLSRGFATNTITGGPNYALGYLAVPTDPKSGAPLYQGPYSGVHQADFDKAVTCSSDNKTITYHFNKPWPDFPLALAALGEFDPYKQSEDNGDKSNFSVFSDGPYMLSGSWDQDKGGTLVRNPQWDPKTDTVRQANPNSIVFSLGHDPGTEEVLKGLIADNDPNAIATSSIPPDLYPKITGAVAKRAVNVVSPFTNYLAPNFNRIKNLKVRQALAAATDREAYVRTEGGERAASPAQSVVNPGTPGYQPNPAYPASGAPDVAKAKSLLQSAGVPMPYPIKLTYPLASTAANNAFAALKQTYDKAGFKVTLDGLDPNGPYYPTIQNPGSDSDLVWAGWGPDWPSVSTVIPPLFDSRVNLTSSKSNGQDNGNYKSDTVNKMIDANKAIVNLDQANAAWAKLDQTLSADVAYIPLDNTKFYYLRGSNIANYVNNPATADYPDLGVISLANGK